MDMDYIDRSAPSDFSWEMSPLSSAHYTAWTAVVIVLRIVEKIIFMGYTPNPEAYTFRLARGQLQLHSDLRRDTTAPTTTWFMLHTAEKPS